jgi:hypothetical protein
METKLNLDFFKDSENENLKVDVIKFQKMILLFNCIEQGWRVKKQNNSYVFTKNHDGKKEIIEDSLAKFMNTNLDVDKIFSKMKFK